MRRRLINTSLHISYETRPSPPTSLLASRFNDVTDLLFTLTYLANQVRPPSKPNSSVLHSGAGD